jgi:two-component system, OmpR family, phosphate regulon sensor histidine kinase PhoR
MRIFELSSLEEMKKKRNTLTMVLMATSLTLLVLLQVLWLKNSYEKAGDDLRREANMLFRTTVMNMWDSVVSRSIRQVPVDSVINFPKVPYGQADSTIAIAQFDTNVSHNKNDSSSVRIIFSTRDSVVPKDVLKPLASRINRMNPDLENLPQRTFILRMTNDTLDREKLEGALTTAFESNDIDRPLILVSSAPPDLLTEKIPGIHRTLHKRIPHETKGQVNARTITTDPVSTGPVRQYSLTLENVPPLLVRRIAPEIFFSIILTALTGSAFFLMFRNIRSQQRLVDSKNDFINNVTHELKTPVATVSVALEAIQNFNVNADPQLTVDYLEIAQRELKRLNEITDRILKTSVLENDIVVTRETTDLNDLISNMLKDMSIIFQERGAQVNYSTEGSNFALHCDAYKLYQMVENLIDNALKYSRGNAGIEIALYGTEKFLTLTVRDNGIGIPKEFHEKVFDKFFRVPTGDVHTIKGYGLGLNYVHNLVRALGGIISVDSETGKGTCLTLKFPRIKVRELSIKIGK